MFLDQEENDDKIADRYIESRGRSFRIICTDPHGFWRVHHARNNKPVVHLPGYFTNLNEAVKAIHALPEDKLPPIATLKTVLTPKIKKKEEDEED